MSFISNIKIRNKLILMLIFPIAGLLYFSFNETWDKSRLATEMKKLQVLSAGAVKISPLVHELQKERGASSVFIGSKGTEFVSELPAQRSDTDKKIAELEAFLEGFDSSQFGPEFKNALDDALDNLGKIKSKRDSISALNISAEESIKYYTDTIASFLDVVAHISRLSTHADLSALISAYVNFLWEKEWAGRERALMSSVFATDRFGPGMFSKFASIVATQDTYMNVFLSFATSDQKDFYRGKVQGRFIDEVARMRRIAFERANEKGLGVDPEDWYSMITSKINLLKEVEDKLSDDLNLKAEQLKDNAQLALASFVVVTVISVLAAIVLAYIVMRSILHPLNKMAEFSQKIASGDMTTDVGVISLKDEIGTVAKAFREMTANLREMLKKTKELSVNVDSAVKMIVDSTHSIHQGSKEQTISMEDVTSLVEGLRTIAINITKGMEQLLRMSEDTSSSILEMTASIEGVDGNVATLTRAVEDISSSVEEIAASLKEMASGIDYISKGADDTVASLVQIDGSAAVIEKHTKEVAELSNEVAKEGEKGVKAVELTHAGMEKIKEEVKQLAMVINNLGQMSEEIGKILNVINDVTEETTLLALNAAILAAQAGEHGRGFSVVAEEMRELSDRTAASTREITGIILNTQDQIKKALESVEEGMAEVMEGEKLSTETIGVLGRIMGRFKTLHDKSLKIADATQDQAKGSKQVTQNMEAITSTIHQMARSTQEQSQGAAQIAEAVERVKEVTLQIKRATTQQAENSRIIASNTENMLRFVQAIDTLYSDQERESQRIAEAVAKTKTIADNGIENSKQLEEVVRILKKEVESLSQGMDRFKV